MGGKGQHLSSSESDDWGDESWIVDCPCGVNYDDGDEMVECDVCGVWVHTACCRVPKGLQTFICDKCKAKKKSEETEVAQLLADLPGKTVSFDERNHERLEGNTLYHTASEIPIEERVYVHGIPGGHPSFFAGATSKVFCRQLWKYSGYVPKYLQVDHNELPEPREDISAFLRDLPDMEVPKVSDERVRILPHALENGHAVLAVTEFESSREYSAMEAVRVHDEDLKDEGKIVFVKKGEGKHSKLRHKSKVKEEKPHHYIKRTKDEAGLKEFSSKKKARNNGDVCKAEDGQSAKADGSSSQEAGVAAKSPQSSPKNPKAMKKLAVQEFMDGDMILCSLCGKVEVIVARALLMTGGSAGGRPNSVCQECERVVGDASCVTSRVESGSDEPVAVAVPLVINTGSTLEVRLVPRRELDYCEDGLKNTRLRGDSLGDMKTVDVDAKDLLKSVTVQHSTVLEDTPLCSVKMEPNVNTLKQSEVKSEGGEICKGFEPAAVRSAAESKEKGEFAVKIEDCSAERNSKTRPPCSNEAEGRSLGDSRSAVCANKPVVTTERHLPEICLDNSQSSSKLAQVLPSVGPVLSTTQAEPEDRSEQAHSKTVATGVSDAVKDETDKSSPLIPSMETKGQGSARTAGHLPASVRGKMLGERSNQQLQRPGTAVQLQAPPLSGHSVLPVSLTGALRPVHTSVLQSMKGNSVEDVAIGKQHTHPEATSPAQHVGKHLQQARLLTSSNTGPHKSPPWPSEILSSSQPSTSAQHAEVDQEVRAKGQLGVSESNHNEVLSPHPLQPVGRSNLDYQEKPLSPKVTPTQVICQQARQLNGIGHVYTSRAKAAANNSKSEKNLGTASASHGLNSILSNAKVSVSLMKSPSSGTSSSSPTSPLVTTPSSKPQPVSVKVPGSPPTHKSVSGGSTPKTSNHTPHVSKFSGSISASTSFSKKVGSLNSSKSFPALPASPLSSKVANQSSRSNSLPVMKTLDTSSSGCKSTSTTTPSRGLNHSGSKEGTKSTTHANSKISTTGKIVLSASTKPPSSKTTNSHTPSKGTSSTSASKHSGPLCGTSKASTLPSGTKHTSGHHGKGGISHKEEKSGMPSAPPVPKAMATMPPPPPQVSTKRSPPTVPPSSAATTLKDEELALLLHQELNSSPRVPRVPRVRQAGASLQLVSSPSVSSAKGSFGSTGGGGSSYKDHHLASRKRTREDRHKDLSKSSSQSAVEVGRSGVKRSENKSEDVKGFSEKSGNSGKMDGSATKEKSSATDSNSRHQCFSKGNLSIIVPGSDEAQDGDKRSPVDNSVVTLPGLIDEVLSGKGHHQLSYEDICDAVLPHWPKLRKANGERYAYVSHRQAVLDCLRNRSAWAHLVDRGPKTNLGRKRRRNDSMTLSDTDDDEPLGSRECDELDTSKPSKRSKDFNGEKWDGGNTSDRQNSDDTSTLDDLPKGKHRPRRRRRVAIEDGTDGEDDEPSSIVERTAVASKLSGETSQDEEPEASSSPSSEEAVSNYSEEDEEMVVHRGIRKRRRPADDDSSASDDDMD